MMSMPAASDYIDSGDNDYTPDPGYAGNHEAAPSQSSLGALLAIMQMPNIAANLETMDDVPDEIKLNAISQLVIEEYKIDKDSCDEWAERLDEALNLATLVSELKDYPFEGSSNVKFPLIATAALQFNARAYSAIVQGNRIAKPSLWGPDENGDKAKRGERVAEQLSYDCLVTMKEWEEDTDRLLLQVSILGSMFRKCWWDPSVGHKRSRIITPSNLVVNYHARSLEDVPRITEKLYLYPYEIQERIRDGRFIKFDYAAFSSDTDPDDEDADRDNDIDRDDKDAPQLFLEQHRLLDLDGDGYSEPYIVTVHYASQKACRIVANYDEDTIKIDAQQQITSIRRLEYFTKYQFLPSPDGGFYGWGFGWLLKDITESINTILNQLIDAGHIQNTQGGFINSAMGIREKSIHLERGEYRVVNFGGLTAQQAIVNVPVTPPSEALFKLLGLLVESGKEVASIKDVLTGDTSATAPVGTTLALIEQGLQVFTSIFKRIFRGLKSELAIHSRLNKDNLSAEEYNDLVGDGTQMFDPKVDFDMSGKGIGIIPVADPNTATRMQKLARAQATLTVADQHANVVDVREAVTRFFEAMDEPDIDKLLPEPPQPDPEEEKIKRILAELVLQDKEATIAKNDTQAMLNAAQADGVASTGELDRVGMILQALNTMIKSNAGDDTGAANTGGVPAVAGPADNGMGNGPAPQAPAVGGSPGPADAVPQFQPGGLPATPA